MPKAAISTLKLSNNPGPGTYAPKDLYTTNNTARAIMPKDAKKPFYD